MLAAGPLVFRGDIRAGCNAARIEDLDALRQAAASARTNGVPTVLEVSVSGQVAPLV